MFETAMIDQPGRRGAWSFSSSLLLQCGLVSGILIVSLWMPIALPEPPELRIATPVPKFRDAVRVVSTSIQRQAASLTPRRPFQYIPPTVAASTAANTTALLDEMVVGLPQPGNPQAGIPDGIGIFPTAVVAPPPPKPAPREVPKPTPPSRQVIGGDVLASKLIHRVQPVYPPLARQMRIQGVVQLHGIITRDGRIAQLRVISGHPMLVKAALDAVGQWVYSPTLLNQQPVEVEAPIEVRFILGQ